MSANSESKDVGPPAVDIDSAAALSLMSAISEKQESNNASRSKRLKKEVKASLVGQHPALKNMDWVIFPDNKFIKIWDLILLVCLFLVTFILPYQIGVSGGVSLIDSIPWLAFNVLINTFFFVDTFLYFFRAYRQKNGVLIFNLRKIQINYLKTLFFPNLFSVIPSALPFYFVVTSTVDPSDTYISLAERRNFLSFLFFINFLKLIRLFRVRTIIASNDAITMFRLRNNSQNLMFVKYLLLLVVIDHWFACIWCFTAYVQAGSFREDALLSIPNWIGYWYENNYEVDSNMPNPIGVRSSIDRYVIALFWAIQTITSIGYGNISPVTNAEWWVGSTLQFLAGISWAYFIGGLVGVAAGMNANDDAYCQRSDEANELISHFDDSTLNTKMGSETSRTSTRDLMNSKIGSTEQQGNLSKRAIARQIRVFIHAQHIASPAHAAINDVNDVFPVLSSLPPELQSMSGLLLFQRAIEKIPYLSSRYLSMEAQSEIALSCKILEFSKGETVTVTTFELGQGIFVFKGGMAFGVKNSNEKPLIDTFELLSSGSAFGWGKVLIDPELNAAKGLLQFLTFSTVVFIPKDAIADVLRKNKRAWKECGRWVYVMTMLRDSNKEYLNNSIKFG